jgi:hypothetical protein
LINGDSVVAGGANERIITKRDIELRIYGEHSLGHAGQNGLPPRKLSAQALEHLFDLGSHARERTFQFPQVVIADIQVGRGFAGFREAIGECFQVANSPCQRPREKPRTVYRQDSPS